MQRVHALTTRRVHTLASHSAHATTFAPPHSLYLLQNHIATTYLCCHYNSCCLILSIKEAMDSRHCVNITRTTVVTRVWFTTPPTKHERSSKRRRRKSKPPTRKSKHPAFGLITGSRSKDGGMIAPIVGRCMWVCVVFSWYQLSSIEIKIN